MIHQTGAGANARSKKGRGMERVMRGPLVKTMAVVVFDDKVVNRFHFGTYGEPNAIEMAEAAADLWRGSTVAEGKMVRVVLR
jgi:hypothetical protein